MKANALQIGDYVTFLGSITDGEILPIKIISLGYIDDDSDGNDAIVQIGDSKGCDVIGIDDEIVGIPLTAEILEKNGFGKCIFTDKQVWKISHSDVYIENTNGPHRYTLETPVFGEPTWKNIIHNLCYVHQLQHALRLCGIEKEIEL